MARQHVVAQRERRLYRTYFHPDTLAPVVSDCGDDLDTAQLPILESPDNGSPRCDAHYVIPCFAGSKPVSHISYALDDVDLVQATGSNETTVFQHSEVIDFASSKPVTLIAK